MAALRTTMFDRGEGQLRYSFRRCPLGIACETYLDHESHSDRYLHRVTRDRMKRNLLVSRVECFESRGHQYQSYLPPVIQHWLDINPCGMCWYEDRLTSIMELNDRDGKSFTDMADIIEDCKFVGTPN